MKVFKLSFIILISGMTLFWIACNKTKALKENDSSKEKTEEKKRILLPSKLESDNLEIKLKYLDNSDLLSEVSNSDGYTIKITYKDKVPVQFDRYKNNNLFNSVYFSNSQKGLKITLFDVSGIVLTPTGSLMLKRNEEDKIFAIQTSGKGSAYPFKDCSWTYNNSGNLSDITTVSTPINTIKYTYDEKNGIFKNIKNAQLLFLEMGYDFFCPEANNRLTYTNSNFPADNTNYTYQYNSEGYPTQFTESKHKKIFKVTYTELSQ